MNNNDYICTGYHGTTKEKAKYIITSKRFPYSCDDEEWLGTGIYFFENDYLQAEDWCTKARGYCEWSVIKSRLEAETVIDLIDKETLNRFNESANKIKNKYKNRRDGKPRKLINAVIIDAMFKVKPYDIIRAAFHISNYRMADRINILPVQIQLCVKNRNCIKSIEEVIDCENI
jgi:hypothetical protein